jgi:hypothetical protein
VSAGADRAIPPGPEGPGFSREEPVKWRNAYVNGGLAVHFLWRGSPKGRQPPGWHLIHINTGHAVCVINAHQPEIWAIADRFVALTDWDFCGLDGWKNADPDLLEKVRALAALLLIWWCR